ncbi:MAG TPA: carboxypeptidase-like regulatory domain-containing protein, partial [Candidatus Angelobacter sp.]|nr:carboxypeptidase-like regulatory domain-containing protein [Candidatus Angelobacter sp.]
MGVAKKKSNMPLSHEHSGILKKQRREGKGDLFQRRFPESHIAHRKLPKEAVMKKLVLLCALCIALFPAHSTRAAEPTGSISGTVVDPSGAAVPGAKITATNVDTG